MSEEVSENISTEEAIALMSTMTGMEMSPDRIPRGIEIEENRVYFYCPVGDKEAGKSW